MSSEYLGWWNSVNTDTGKTFLLRSFAAALASLLPTGVHARNMVVGSDIVYLLHYPVIATIVLWGGMLFSERTRFAVVLPFVIGSAGLCVGILGLVGSNFNGDAAKTAIYILTFTPLVTFLLTVISLVIALLSTGARAESRQSVGDTDPINEKTEVVDRSLKD